MTIKVIDFYEEDPEVIGVASSFSEANAIRIARIEDTDGECEIGCYCNGKDVTHLVTMYNPEVYY